MYSECVDIMAKAYWLALTIKSSSKSKILQMHKQTCDMMPRVFLWFNIAPLQAWYMHITCISNKYAAWFKYVYNNIVFISVKITLSWEFENFYNFKSSCEDWYSTYIPYKIVVTSA